MDFKQQMKYSPLKLNTDSLNKYYTDELSLEHFNKSLRLKIREENKRRFRSKRGIRPGGGNM